MKVISTNLNSLHSKINSLYVIQVVDTTGNRRLVGAGKLHKVIGMRGEDIADELFVNLLRMKEMPKPKYRSTKVALRGIEIRFSKRKLK